MPAPDKKPWLSFAYMAKTSYVILARGSRAKNPDLLPFLVLNSLARNCHSALTGGGT